MSLSFVDRYSAMPFLTRMPDGGYESHKEVGQELTQTAYINCYKCFASSVNLDQSTPAQHLLSEYIQVRFKSYFSTKCVQKKFSFSFKGADV